MPIYKSQTFYEMLKLFDEMLEWMCSFTKQFVKMLRWIERAEHESAMNKTSLKWWIWMEDAI